MYARFFCFSPKNMKNLEDFWSGNMKKLEDLWFMVFWSKNVGLEISLYCKAENIGAALVCLLEILAIEDNNFRSYY